MPEKICFNKKKTSSQVENRHWNLTSVHCLLTFALLKPKKNPKMKTFIKIALVALVLGGLSLASCKKYQDGPTVSLLTKKSRLANTWTVEKYMQDGVDKTADYRQWISSDSYTMDKSGTWTSAATTILGNSTDAGTWTFINSKEDLRTISNQTGSTADTVQIIRLKSNELWTKSMSGSPVIETHYISK